MSDGLGGDSRTDECELAGHVERYRGEQGGIVGLLVVRGLYLDASTARQGANPTEQLVCRVNYASPDFVAVEYEGSTIFSGSRRAEGPEEILKLLGDLTLIEDESVRSREEKLRRRADWLFAAVSNVGHIKANDVLKTI